MQSEQFNQNETIVPADKLRISFFGDGAKFFGIVALNVLLTVVTLGIYYPWAKATYRKYLWNETEFKGSRFVFNGTGKEMFKGFIIAYGIFILIFGGMQALAFLAQNNPAMIIALPLVYLVFLLLIPFAIFGAWRYRVTRTSWRGIFMQFDGNLKEFLGIFFKNLLFTILTIGIYSAWMRVNIMKYLFSHTKVGDLEFDFHGKGADLFVINIIGGILLYPTLFMYTPIWMKKRFEFTVNHTTIQDNEKRRALFSTLSNKEAWTTMMLNFVMLLFTLGLAFPWTLMRKLRMYFDNLQIPSEFDYDNLSQSPTNYTDATGDEMSDILDIGLDF